MKLAFLFYEGMTALDSIGPHEVLTRLPGAVTTRVAKQAGQILTDSGVAVSADVGFADLTRADILIIPGASSATSMRDDPETLDWVRMIHRSTTWTTSVCTGSLILGRAGLLKGVRATSHWATHERLSYFGALPVAARVVEDGKIMTAAGVSAGIDMALTLAARIFGSALAQTLQLALEYDPAPPFDAGHPSKVKAEQVTALHERMSRSFESHAAPVQPDS